MESMCLVNTNSWLKRTICEVLLEFAQRDSAVHVYLHVHQCCLIMCEPHSVVLQPVMILPLIIIVYMHACMCNAVTWWYIEWYMYNVLYI